MHGSPRTHIAHSHVCTANESNTARQKDAHPGAHKRRPSRAHNALQDTHSHINTHTHEHTVTSLNRAWKKPWTLYELLSPKYSFSFW
jgi:hypothetical protein